MTDPFTLLPGAVGALPLHYGNPLAEQRALLAGAIVDLADRDVVTVTGPDRLSWLDSLLSQSLAGLAPGESAETLLLDPSGRIEYAARVVDDGETTWLLMDAGTGAGLAAGRGGGLRLGLALRVVHHHVPAACSQPRHRGCAHPGARTGDEGDLIFQHGVDSWVCSMAGVDAREDRSPRPRPARVARHDRRAE